MRTIIARLKALHREETGQSLVFGVMSVFIMLMFGAMIIAVGRVSTRRIQMQFAADSAAYSSALVESECLNAIGLLNTGMAQVRGRTLRYVADVNVYGALAELRDEVLALPERMDDGLGRYETGVLAPYVGSAPVTEIAALRVYFARWRDALRVNGDPDQPLLEATDEAFWTQQETVLAAAALDAELTRHRTWWESQLEYCREMRAGLHAGADLAQPLLSTFGSDPLWLQGIVGVDRAEERYVEAYERAADWLGPANEWLQEMSRLEHTVTILAPYVSAETSYAVSQENGAEYASIFPCSRWLPREDAYFDLHVYRFGEKWWRVEGDNRAMEVQGQDCGTCSACPGCGECTQCWLISWYDGGSQAGRYRVCQLTDRRWFLEDLLRGEQACIQQVEEFHVVTWAPQGVEVIVHDEYDPHWLEIINTNGEWPGNTIFVRNVDGVVETARYQWDAANEEWVLPTEEDFTPLPSIEVEVDGVRVGVTLDPIINLPGRAVIRTLEPAYIELRDILGNTWGRAHLDDTTSFWTQIHGVNAWIENDDFRLRHRGQDIYRGHADGRWRAHFDPVEEYWWQHRLTEVETDHWQYEYMEFGARLAPETNMARLLAHRDVENDPPVPGESATGQHLPPWAHDADLNPDGWLDPAAGSLVRDEDGAYVYHQVRPTDAFDPLDSNGNTEPADGYWWIDLNQDGVRGTDEEIVSPYGADGTVRMDPASVFNRQGRAERDTTNPHRGAIQADDHQEAGFVADHLPLVLTEEFFKFGFTAGVWHRRETHFPSGAASGPDRPVEYLLHDAEPGFKGLMKGTPGSTPRERGENVRPAWGYFAVAAARPRLRRPGAFGDWNGLQQGAWFDDVDVRQAWIDENLNNLYLKAEPSGWSYWDARMIGLDHQVLDEDVLLDQTTAYETGVGWLMTRIAEGSPGGLIRSRHGHIWDPRLSPYGVTGGWASDIYGGYDESYPPAWVRRDLTQRLRPRVPTARMGAPYHDADGALRDPLSEHLADRPFGSTGREDSWTTTISIPGR